MALGPGSSLFGPAILIDPDIRDGTGASPGDLVSAGSHVGERSEVCRQRDDVEWPVVGDEMPLIARGKEGRGWRRS